MVSQSNYIFGKKTQQRKLELLGYTIHWMQLIPILLHCDSIPIQLLCNQVLSYISNLCFKAGTKHLLTQLLTIFHILHEISTTKSHALSQRQFFFSGKVFLGALIGNVRRKVFSKYSNTFTFLAKEHKN